MRVVSEQAFARARTKLSGTALASRNDWHIARGVAFCMRVEHARQQ